MADTPKDWLDRVYDSTTPDELEESYDGWAAGYEADLLASGYRVPTVAAGLAGRHLPAGTGPILDAGCGTGFIGEALHVLGYPELEGLDLSEGMLEVARGKRIYRALHRAMLGEPLDLPDDHYTATVAIGVLTKGHAGPEAFPELVRATAPGGHMIFSIRVDSGVGEPYLAEMDALADAGRWRRVEVTPAFLSMPISEPEVRHRVFVYRIV
jgi:predicted TPR repeat methyltransferase